LELKKEDKMELNKTTRGTNKPTAVMNEEGSIVNGRRPEIQLYLEGSNLKITEDEFYTKANDKLKSFVSLANTVDTDFTAGLSKFLVDSGLKLSPVVLTSVLANKGTSFNADKDYLKIFNTPQRIAEAIALENAGYLKLNNSFKKHILKEALQNMNQFTLRKNKLTNRIVKTYA
jgi:hypothetical protein